MKMNIDVIDICEMWIKRSLKGNFCSQFHIEKKKVFKSVIQVSLKILSKASKKEENNTDNSWNKYNLKQNRANK